MYRRPGWQEAGPRSGIRTWPRACTVASGKVADVSGASGRADRSGSSSSDARAQAAPQAWPPRSRMPWKLRPVTSRYRSSVVKSLSWPPARRDQTMLGCADAVFNQPRDITPSGAQHDVVYDRILTGAACSGAGQQQPPEVRQQHWQAPSPTACFRVAASISASFSRCTGFHSSATGAGVSGSCRDMSTIRALGPI
jgi:hypothetical protein